MKKATYRNAALLFTSGTKMANLHDEINLENYETWLSKKLIPNLPEKSVPIVKYRFLTSYNVTRWMRHFVIERLYCF